MLAHSSFSAGCGRTGTIIAVDYAWTLLKMNVSNKNTCTGVKNVSYKQFHSKLQPMFSKLGTKYFDYK